MVMAITMAAVTTVVDTLVAAIAEEVMGVAMVEEMEEVTDMPNAA
jgi:hypothetical protein